MRPLGELLEARIIMEASCLPLAGLEVDSRWLAHGQEARPVTSAEKSLGTSRIRKCDVSEKMVSCPGLA